MDNTASLLRMVDIVKNFPGNRGVDEVTFDCRAGEIHCLVGENGAGKSTLMKMIAGVYFPDAGTIFFENERCDFRSYADARKKGIGVVYQELSLLPNCSVAENISMGMWPKKKCGIDWRKTTSIAEKVLAQVNLKIDVNELVGELPMAVRQMVEIGKVISQDPKLIIFDEPTASLSKDEVKILFGIIRNLRAAGKAIIYISHRLEEVFELADRVTVMKDGKKVVTDSISAFDENSLISKMVGRDLKEVFPPKSVTPNPVPIFEYSVTYQDSGRPVAFSVRSGEVLGIGGLQGQGQIRLLQSIFGIEEVRSMTAKIRGKPVTITNQASAVQTGIALIPENRGEEGVFLGASVYENLASATLDERKQLGFIRKKDEKSAVSRMVEDLSVKISSFDQSAISLSGGNMQKLVIGKWLIGSPKVIIMLEPTKGVDVGTKQQIYSIVRSLANNGSAVIVYTSDMLELIGLSDRVLVMGGHRFTGEFSGTEITEENIMKAAVSQKDMDGNEIR